MRRPFIFLLGVLCVTTLGQTADKRVLPKPLAERLLADPALLFPAARDLVRRWAKSPLPSTTAKGLEVLDAGSLPDPTLLGWIEDTEPAVSVAEALIGQIPRPTLFASLEARLDRPASPELRARVVGLAVGPANPRAKAIAKRALQSRWVKGRREASLWRIVLKNPAADDLELGVKLDAEPYLLAEAIAKFLKEGGRLTPGLRDWLVRTASAGADAADHAGSALAGHSPQDFLAAFEAVTDLEKARELLAKVPVPLRHRLLDGHPKALALVKASPAVAVSSPLFALVPAGERARLLEGLIAGPEFEKETRGPILDALATLPSGPGKTALVRKAIERLRAIHQRNGSWLTRAAPPMAGAKRRTADEMLALAADPQLPDDLREELLTLATPRCRDYLPFRIATFSPLTGRLDPHWLSLRVRPPAADGSAGFPAKKIVPSPEEKKAFFDRYGDRYVDVARQCLNEPATDALAFCYSVEVLKAAGRMDYTVIERALRWGRHAGRARTDRLHVAQCTSAAMTLPVAPGEKRLLTELWTPFLPTDANPDDPDAGLKAYTEFESLSTSVKGAPVEAHFLAVVRDSATRRRFDDVSPCTMTCRLRASAPQWRVDRPPEDREPKEEGAFSEDMLYTLFDLRSADLCGETPKPAGQYLTKLPLGVRGVGADGREQYERELAQRESAAATLDTFNGLAKSAAKLPYVGGTQVESHLITLGHATQAAKREVLAQPSSYPGQLTNTLLYSLILGKKVADELGPRAVGPEVAELAKWRTPLVTGFDWALGQSTTAYDYRKGNSVWQNFSLGLAVLWGDRIPPSVIAEMRAGAEKVSYQCTVPYSARHAPDPEDEALYRSVVFYAALAKKETDPEGRKAARGALRRCLKEYGPREALGRYHARRGVGTHMGQSGHAPYYHYSTLFLALELAYEELDRDPAARDRPDLETSIAMMTEGLKFLYDRKTDQFQPKSSQTYVRRPAYVNPLYGLASAIACKRGQSTLGSER